MVKPTLLLNHGTGWSATSPLIYTLQRLAKYCHNGHTKATNYFYILNNSHIGTTRDDKITSLKPKVLNNTWENWNSHIGHKLNTTEDLLPIKDFPLDVFEDFATPPYTLDKYVRYYNTLWDIVEPQGYKAVSDFSPYFGSLNTLRKNLSDFNFHNHFYLKGIVIVRDPIRRAWSQFLSIKSRRNTNETFDDFMTCYITQIDIIKQHINPNIHIVVMEELWEGNGKEKDKLSNFLGHPVTDLWKNGYAPDKGHLVTENDCTPCQFAGQRDAILTPELYREYRKQYSYIYDNWKRRFGILPRYWGRPINYESNASL